MQTTTTECVNLKVIKNYAIYILGIYLNLKYNFKKQIKLFCLLEIYIYFTIQRGTHARKKREE